MMTVASALTALNQDVQYARTAIINKGGTVTVGGGSSQLATDIQNIPTYDIITATNKTGLTISAGDKVWVNKVGADYELINFYQGDYLLNLVTYANSVFNSSTGIASNITSNNAYFDFYKKFLPSSNTWEMVYCFKTPSTINANNMLVGTSSTSVHTFYQAGVSLELASTGYFGAGVSSNGTSWDIGWLNVLSGALIPATWYWIKLIFDGTRYTLYLSTDGITFNYESHIDSTTKIYASQPAYLRIGQIGSVSNRYWRGEIDLSKSYIKIDNNIWWQGCNKSTVKDDVLTGYAQESIANNTSGSVKTILPGTIDVTITVDADDADITAV